MVKNLVIIVVLFILFLSIISIYNSRGIVRKKIGNKNVNENKIVSRLKIIGYCGVIVSLFLVLNLK